MALEASKSTQKYTFTDADAGDLPVNERSDDEEEEEEGEEEEEEEQQQQQQDEEEQGHAGVAGSLDDSDNDA